MQRQVVVDDTDPQIQYTGIGWFKDQGSQDGNGNYGPTYRKTSHGTVVNNDSFSFSFNGTSFTVLGTTHLVKIDNGTRFDPTIECFVDQVSIGSTKPFEFPENNWPLCGRGGLNDGQHTITVKIMTTGNTFWFDYLTYMPSPKVSFDEAVLFVENTDPAVIFGAGWGNLGGIANQTTLVGSQAKFDFIGKSISWVGFVPVELPHGAAAGSFVIDNGQPVDFELNGLSATETASQYNQVFFTTPDLAPGPHSIVVTYKGGNGPSTPLTLDHIYVTNTSIPQPATSGATSSSPSATGGSKGDGQAKKSPVGAIVGGVLGGLAFIFLIVVLWWLQRRRREKDHIKSDGVNPFPSTLPETDIDESRSGTSSTQVWTPFTQSSPPASRNPGSLGKVSRATSPAQSTPSGSRAPSAIDNNASRTRRPTKANIHANTVNFEGAARTTDQPQAMREASRPSVLPVHHQDSGIRLQSQVVTNDIPPPYTAA